MKKIINGKRYDTETAKFIVSDEYNGSRSDFQWWSEKLYRKNTGEFFIYGEGGPASKYAEAYGQNSWGGGEKITPISLEKAQKWVEDHASADKYEEIFGVIEEDESRITQPLRLSAFTIELLKRKAAETQKSMSDIAEDILNKELKS